MIIAFTGYKRSGKDTASDYLVSEYGFQNKKLAGHLKATLHRLFGWNTDHTDGDLKEVIDPDFGVRPREVMQWFGTECMQFKFPASFPLFEEQVGRTFWCQRLWEDLALNKQYVLSDLRFPHEEEFFRHKAEITGEPFFIVRINRPGCTADGHMSETSIDNVLPDFIIDNDGTLDQLYANIDNVLYDIERRFRK